jgi:hypothetical protein
MPDYLLANNGLTGSLAYSFSRAAATVDDDGVVVASGVPRYGRAAQLCATPAFTTIGSVSSGYALMQTGVAADGTTLLMITLDGTGQMRIHSGTLGNVVKSWTNVGTQQAGAVRDILQTYGNQESTVAYSPYAAVVCHGAFVVSCRRFHWTGAVWEERGIAVVASQNNGTSWTVLKDKDANHIPTLNIGGLRGNLWGFTGYYPTNVAVSEAWFAVVDYMNSGHGTGGQTVLMRAIRTGLGAWMFGPLYLGDSDADGHFHTAMFFKPADAAYAGKGYLVTSQGDSGDARGRVRVCNDPANYQLDASWSAVNEFAGGGDDPDAADRGLTNQWAGVQAAGPGSASAYVGHDVTPECVSKMTVAVDGTLSYARKFGVGGAYFDPIWMQCPTPELGGPYVTRTTATRTGAEQRYLYSRTGEYWTTIGRGDNGAKASLPCFFGGQIIFMSGSGVSDVVALALPADVSNRRPLRIGPGGTNLVKAQSSWTYHSGGVRAGHTVTFPARGTLDVEPPTPATAPVGRVVTTGENLSDFVESFAWSGNSGTQNVDWYGIESGTAGETMTVRYLIRPIANGRVNVRHLVGSQVGEGTNVEAKAFTSGWLPVVTAMSTAAWGAALRFFGINVYAVPNPVGDTRAMQTSYEIAPDLIYNKLSGDAAIPGYPVAPGTTGPDEDFKVTLGLTGSTWTVGVVTREPHDGPESSMSAAIPSVPHFTLYVDANNSIEYVKDYANSRLTMNVKIAGVTTTQHMTGIYWQREDYVRVVTDSNGTTISCEASVAGGPVLTASVAGVFGTQPIDARFEKADGTTACVDFYACVVHSTAAAAYDADEAFETPPTAPTALTATAVGGGSIDLTWQDNSDNETGFEIWRKVNT